MKKFLVPLRLHPGARDADRRHSVRESAESTAEKLDPRTLARCSSQQARAVVEFDIASRLGILPLGLMTAADTEMLSVAVPSEMTLEEQRHVRFAAGRELHIIRVPKPIIERAISIAYHGDERELSKELSALQQRDRFTKKESNPGQIDFKPVHGDVARFLAALIEHAIAREASDLHLVPMHDGGFLRLRIDGTLLAHEQPICSLALFKQVITRVKVLAQLPTATKNMPLDGAMRVPLAAKTISVRVSIMPTIHGEKAVLRFLAGEEVRTLDRLGLIPEVLQMVERTMECNEGLVLCAGATGSGKSTTMYALLHEFAGRDLSVVSIEDPVEQQLSGVAQTAIDPAQGLTYAHCLRAILRQDPDVIMVGEIRDSESAATAINAALTGHLLLSSVHARNACEVAFRLRELDVDVSVLAQALELIVVQRLLPRLCDECKVFDLAASRVTGGETFQPVGCVQCDYSGFSGRVLACEAVAMTAPLRQALIAGRFAEALADAEAGGRYIPLRHSLCILLREGKIGLAGLERELGERELK